jgi:hypothetical protein
MTTRSITCPPISTRVILHAGRSAKAQNARVTMESKRQAVGAGQHHIETRKSALSA